MALPTHAPQPIPALKVSSRQTSFASLRKPARWPGCPARPGLPRAAAAHRPGLSRAGCLRKSAQGASVERCVAGWSNEGGRCGKHTPGGGSRGGGDRGACVWPRASAQQSRSRLEARARQGGCENPPPLKDQNAHRFGNTSKARSRGSNEQARRPKLANRCLFRSSHNSLQAPLPQQVLTYRTTDTPQTSTARRSSSPSTGGTARRLSARAASCAAHQLSLRNTSSTKPLALSLGWHSGPDPAEHVQHNPHNTATTKRSAPPRREGAGIAALPRCDSVRRLRMEAACSTADERALHRGAGRGGCRLGRSQSEGGRVGETKATDGWLWDQTRFLRSRTICDGAAVTDIGVAVSVLGSAARRAGHLYPGLRLTRPPRLRAGGEQ